CMQNTEDPTF
nr:immunoglobulin light chain junction region [Macaca mulatta]MOV80507.1 immunoglobulin light chain junction region [Macaca mulatta]MOV80625.1 immunoglobulin light chain junction region [Macaca mulatta]MOV80991.1 immunoglobulin light chain junction region [Macaca mulatta]MOV81315.1 immunoglobulin light chain junction region [Macaca mulatta]